MLRELKDVTALLLIEKMRVLQELALPTAYFPEFTTGHFSKLL
jgi:hypothetical protein